MKNTRIDRGERMKVEVNQNLLNHIGNKLGCKIQTYEILGNGEHNVNYVLESNSEKFVLRIYANTQFKNSSQEYKILKKINGEVAPRVFFLDTSKKYIKHDYMIQEFIEGKPIGKFSKKNIAKVANLLKKVHQIRDLKEDREWKKPIGDWSKNNILIKSKLLGDDFHLQMQKLYREVFQEMERVKPLAKRFKRASLIHDDPVASNFFEKKNGELILLDWEFAHFDYFFLDFGCVIAESHLDKNLENLLLRVYGFGFKPKENEIVQAVKINRALSLISWLIERIASSVKGEKMFAKENVTKYKKRLKKEIKYIQKLIKQNKKLK